MMPTFGEWMTEKYSSQGFNPVKDTPPKFLLCMMSMCDDEARRAYKDWGIPHTYDNSPAKEVLGIQFTPIKTVAYELADQLIENGYIKKPAKK